MKLKRLEIIGFKSFADKTVLSFEKEITAIVGPNGCGKSNVVDSIRWVMGEMSAKHLRGKSMEDIIFSGSDKRAPLSMGSVELTFSTEGYQTPVNYLNHSEISIGRRLYRTGESEYFINKTPVRHKDVIDLFLGTGVGTKAYSIIEQGRISQIITAKPEERRYYIEEVAGISKFKSRKEAALRKMEATQQNLLRLNDIVAELERQLKTLERQAKKAEKYKVVKEELTKLDLALLSTNYSTHNQEQLQKEEALKEASINEASVQSSVLERENEIETTRHQLLMEEEEIQNLQNSVFEITNYIGLAEARLRYKKEEKEKLVSEKNNLEKEKLETQTRYQNAKQTLFKQGDETLDIVFEEATLREQVEFLEKEVEEKGNLFSQLKQEEETLKEQSYKVESRLSQIETIQKNLIDKKQDLSQNLENQTRELSKVEIQFKEMTKLHKELEGNLVSLKQLKLDLNAKTDTLANELATHRENLKNLEKDLASLKEELTLRQSRLASLMELQRNFEGYQEGPRSVLLKKDEIAKDSIFGTVADFVETEPRFEGAVSAVLGEKLQYVVVKSQETGLHASEYLSTQSGGRSSFVPMGLRNYESDSGDIPEQPGVLGPLSRFVKLRENYENLSPFLFGDVVLVEDLKKALNLWETNGHRKTLVTLNGEVVDPTGVITGGTLANTSKALLEKKREMKELEELISNLQGSVSEREVERLSLEARVETLSNALESMKNSRLEEEIRITHQEKDLSTFKKDIEALSEKQNVLKNSVEEKNRNLNNINPELEALSGEQEELIKEKANIEARLPEIKSAFENVKVVYEAQKQGLTEAQINLAKITQTLSYATNAEEQTLNLICELRMAEAEKEAKISNLIFSEEFLKKEALHIEKVLGKKMEKAALIKETLQGKKESFESKNASIRQKEAELKTLRETLTSATKALNDITLQLSEIRNNLKHIVEQALERYNLILVDVYEKFLDTNLPIEQTQTRVTELREQMSRIGDVNTEALTEFEETQKRYQFLSTQKVDLENSLSTLEKVIHKINRTTRERFMATFDAVNAKFQEVFPKLFRGGKAHLQLTDETNLLETGVEIAAQPPGKKLQTINLLSGGEKALTAISLVFSIFQIKPSPFCILDEVDAPLDEANVERYNEMIRLMTDRTQFIVITHNKRTMEACDALYGITMPEPGISQMVSVDLGK